MKQLTIRTYVVKGKQLKQVRKSHELLPWQKLKHLIFINITAWKVFKYGVFSGPYFPEFRLNSPNAGNTDHKTPYLETFHAVYDAMIWTYDSTLCYVKVTNFYCSKSILPWKLHFKIFSGCFRGINHVFWKSQISQTKRYVCICMYDMYSYVCMIYIYIYIYNIYIYIWYICVYIYR